MKREEDDRKERQTNELLAEDREGETMKRTLRTNLRMEREGKRMYHGQEDMMRDEKMRARLFLYPNTNESLFSSINAPMGGRITPDGSPVGARGQPQAHPTASSVGLRHDRSI